MVDQVFISYSDDDRSTAESTHDFLEQAGVRCWLAYRDLLPGVSWSQKIIDEIHASRVMILLLSRHSNASQYVIREVVAAIERQLPIITVRIEDLQPSHRLKFFIGAEQWLDAFNLPAAQYQERLLTAVRLLLEQPADAGAQPAVPAVSSASIAHADAAGAVRLRSFMHEHRRMLRAGVAVLVLVPSGVVGVSKLRTWQERRQELQGQVQETSFNLVIADTALSPTVGDTFQLRADFQGVPQPVPAQQPPLRWWSSDSAIVSLVDSAKAIFRAVGAGTAFVHAQSGLKRDSVSVGVRSAPVASLSITPPPSIAVGGSHTLRAIVKDAAGRTVPGAMPDWSSETPQIVSVDAARGLVTGLAAGRGRIRARMESATTTVEILVRTGRVVSPPRPIPGASLQANPVVPSATAPSAAQLQGLADICITALRKGDFSWLESNYQPVTTADKDNLRALKGLLGQPSYQVTQVYMPKFAEAAIDFRADFSYRRFTGSAGKEYGTFRVLATSDAGRWRVASCRIVGKLVRS